MRHQFQVVFARRRAIRRSAWRLLVPAIGLLGTCVAYAQAPHDSATSIQPLGEVMVTARKVEENLQDIPMSVEILSAAFLDTADITRLYELQFNVPGLVVNNLGMNGAGFSIRGVADQGGSSLSVTTHLDGVYLGQANLAVARMFDLQRVEVLKGPQGTLYGRNATGGSINFITRSPGDQWTAGIETAYGSFDTTRAQGHLNLPHGRTAWRLAFVGSEGDGYIRNSVDDRRFAENDFWGLRGSLRIDASERLRANLMVQHVEDDGASDELWTPTPAYLADPGDIRLATVTLANPYMKTSVDNVSANIEYDLGFATLYSVTGYAQSEVRDRDDCAGQPRLRSCVRGVSPAKYDQWSQELRLASRSGSGVAWLAGAFYFDADGSRNTFQHLPAVNPAPLTEAHSTTDETAYALFGQATWQIADRWSITGGLRQSHEKNRVSSIGTGVQDSPTLKTGDGAWDGTSWRLDLEYAANDDVLVFAGLATGFKSGGITTNVLATGEFDTFDTENLTAFEVGAKTRWLNRRVTLNGSAFYYDFDDMQVSTVTLVDDRLVTEIDNAAEAELYGIDADAAFQASDWMALSAGVVWMPKREFVKYRNDLTGDILSGNEVTRAPEWIASAAIDFEYPLLEAGRLSFRIEYNYRSGFFYTKENDPLYAQDGFGLLNAFLQFEPANGRWNVFASGRNLTDQDYFNQVFLQSNPGYPDTYELGFGYRF